MRSHALDLWVLATVVVALCCHCSVASKPGQAVGASTSLDRTPATSPRPDSSSVTPTPAVDDAITRIAAAPHVRAIGVAVIQAQQLAWHKAYGEQSPGVAVNADTLFGLASITKTVASEAILRQVAAGKLSLHESMSQHWIDPDLADDERHALLTPKLALTHTTGLPNWRYALKGAKLAFVLPPGTDYRYSGEGFQYLATFVERKLDTDFAQLVESTVFTPLGMHDTSLVVRKSNFPRIVQSRDKSGTFFGHYCSSEGWCAKDGSYSAAYGLVATAADYATFLIAAMKGHGLTPQLKAQRDTIWSLQKIIKGFDCSLSPKAICPTRQGYGLGWNVVEWEGGKLIGHSGETWSEFTLAYYYPASGDGLVVFINAADKPTGFSSMLKMLALLDPESPKVHEYRFRLDRLTQ